MLSPPFVVCDPSSIAQQIAIPILASTDASIARLDGTDVALHFIVGAWKLGYTVATDQVCPQVREAMLLVAMEHAALRQCLQFPIPGIEALPDLLVGDLFFSLGPTAVQDMLSCQNPRAHLLHLLNAAVPPVIYLDDFLEAVHLLLAFFAPSSPPFSPSSKLFLT